MRPRVVPGVVWNPKQLPANVLKRTIRRLKQGPPFLYKEEI